MTRCERIRLLAFCLLAGALVNIGAAWGCAIWSIPDWETFARLSDAESQSIWDRYAPRDWSQPLSHFDHAIRGVSLGVSREMIYASDGFHGIVRVQTGWPLKSVEACGRGEEQGDELDARDAAPSHIDRVGALVLPAGLERWSIHAGAWLPYSPIWSGVIINTVFYAAIAWLLVRSPLETRRRWRQWRGVCEKCAYPIGESSVCTECGAVIKLRADRGHRTASTA